MVWESNLASQNLKIIKRKKKSIFSFFVLREEFDIEKLFSFSKFIEILKQQKLKIIIKHKQNKKKMNFQNYNVSKIKLSSSKFLFESYAKIFYEFYLILKQ